MVPIGLHAGEQADQPTGTNARRWPPSLVGTWRVTVQFQDCQTGAPLGNRFYSLLTFSSDGTMGGTTVNPAFMPGQRSPDFGVWQRIGRSVYSATDEALIGFAGGPFTSGLQTLRHTITLAQDGATFADHATVQFADFNGNTVTPAQGCAGAVGTRVE
jgi:hypothetical protein